MALVEIYKIIFATGVLYAVVSFLLGQLFDFNHIQLHVHLDGEMPLFGGISPIKPITIVTFITVFGGVGLMISDVGFSNIVSLLISFIAALITSFLMFRLIVIPLYKHQNTSVSSQKDLIGTSATVVSTIFKDGFGEIKYVKNKNTYSAPAKHISNKTIGSGEQVFIVKIEDNIFYVDYSMPND